MTAPTVKELAQWLPEPQAQDDKYSRGVVGMRTGSARYPGAAVLGVGAAWAAGAGMVRYSTPESTYTSPDLPTPASAVLTAHPETVFDSGRCDAWVCGSGTTAEERTAAETRFITDRLGERAPVVLDAGALDLAAAAAAPAAAPAAATQTIVTPHWGEFCAMWEKAGLPELPAQPDRGACARELAQHLNAVVVLKGSVTHIAAPEGRVESVGPSSAYLATAGSGDVLAGVLGSLLAQNSKRCDGQLSVAQIVDVAKTAVRIHALAAEFASDTHRNAENREKRPARSFTASALIPAVTHAIAHTRAAAGNSDFVWA